MTIKMKDVRAALEPEEPDYDQAAAMGEEALPHLRKLIKGDNIELAAKATSLAGIIACEGSLDVLKLAAESQDPIVRVAAAGAALDLPESDASSLLEGLIGDTDIGVQKMAIKAVPSHPSDSLLKQLTDMSVNAGVAPDISASASAIVSRLGGEGGNVQQQSANEMPGIGEGAGGYDAALSLTSNVESIPEETKMPGSAHETRSAAMPGETPLNQESQHSPSRGGPTDGEDYTPMPDETSEATGDYNEMP